jgi:hypothetical protein
MERYWPSYRRSPGDFELLHGDDAYRAVEGQNAAGKIVVDVAG